MQKFWSVLFRFARVLVPVQSAETLVPFSFSFLYFVFSLSGRFAIQRVCNSTRACACRPIFSRDLARETRRCIMNNNRAHNIAEWKVARHGGCTALPLCRCSRRLSARHLDFAISLAVSPRGHLQSSAFLLSFSWRLLRHTRVDTRVHPRVLLLSFLICHELRHPPRWYEIEP